MAIVEFGGAIYMGASDGVHGYELMKVYSDNFVRGTASTDQITLTQDADHAHIDWTNGGNSGRFTLGDPDGLTIYGNGSNDTIALVGTNALPNTLHLNGTFTINGLTGPNPLANTNLDIGTSTVYIPYANPSSDPIAAIRGYLKNGYNNGLWNGTPTASMGVITSGAAGSNANSSIGFADSADSGNPAGLPADTIELRYTILGDANLNGSVDINDYNAVVRNFGTGTAWDQGDVTYETNVSINDYNAVVRNFGRAASSPAAMPTAQALTAESTQAGTTPSGAADTSAHKKRSFSRKTVSSWKF